MKSNKTYHYILIRERLYINVKQNIIILFFILFLRAKPFTFFERKTSNQMLNRLPTFVIRVIRVLQFTSDFYKKKKSYEMREVLPNVTSQYVGHCLLRLREGEYKIFNLIENKVITVFPEYISTTEVEKRIATIKKAAKYEIAPNVISWNVNDRFLIEDYINLYRPSYSLNRINDIYVDIYPILENIMTSGKPKVVNSWTYIRDKGKELQSHIHRFKEVNSDYFNDISIIEEFSSCVIKKLHPSTINERVVLVHSHGDFWEGNILIKHNESCVIDWGTLGNQSCYFDFMYMMFMLASKNSPFEKVYSEGLMTLIQKVKPCFEMFFNKLKGNDYFTSIEMKNNIKQFDVYRYLFYVELMSLKLKGTGNADKQIRETATWVRRFIFFEENSRDQSQVLQSMNE